MRFGVPVFALLLLGCQSKAEGLRVVCDAPVDCAGCMRVGPDQQQVVLAKHITDRLSNGEVQELLERMAQLPAGERIALLEGEARAAGLASCPIIEVFQELEGPAPDEGGGGPG